MKCPACNEENPAGARYCFRCGTSLTIGDSKAPSTIGRLDTRGEQTGEAAEAKQRSLGDLSTNGPAAAPTAKDSEGDLVGGRYEILEHLGEGGMGIVYRVRDTKLDRTVAIKRLRAANDVDRRELQRFQHEARAIASLNHRNIVTIFELGEDPKGPFIVMEYLGGGDLEKLLAEKKRLEVSTALELLGAIARALGYAHRRGVIHRDVKPANILMDAGGVPKLVDFGLAQVVHDSSFSRTGDKVGTLAYMPPEQKRDSKHADHRSDIFSLAKTFYQMITGLLPDPVDPDRIPAHLRGAVMRAIKPLREDRPFSIEEFLEDLENPSRGLTHVATGRGPALEEGSCAQCNFKNPLEVRFCRACGAGLFEPCPNCGEEDRVGLDFCGSCGVRVSSYREAAECLSRGREHLSAHAYSKAVKDSRRGLQTGYLEKELGELREEAQRGLDEIAGLRANAMELLEEQRFEEAVVPIQESLQRDPSQEDLTSLLADLPRRIKLRDYEALLVAAFHCAKRGDQSEAEKQLTRAAEIDPERAERDERVSGIRAGIRARRSNQLEQEGRRLVDQRRFAAAADHLRMALALAPEREDLKKLLGELPERSLEHQIERLLRESKELIDRRNYKKALAKLRKALRLSPAREDVKDRLDRLVHDLRERNLGILLTRADKLFHVGRYEEAEASLQQALSVDPERDSVRQALAGFAERVRDQRFRSQLESARTAISEGQFFLALDYCRKAREVDPSREESAAMEASIAEQQRHYADRKAWFEALRQAGREEEAVHELRALANRHPWDSDLRSELARLDSVPERVRRLRKKAHEAVKNEQRKTALAAWHQILRLSEGDREARREIERLTRRKSAAAWSVTAKVVIPIIFVGGVCMAAFSLLEPGEKGVTPEVEAAAPPAPLVEKINQEVVCRQKREQAIRAGAPEFFQVQWGLAEKKLKDAGDPDGEDSEVLELAWEELSGIYDSLRRDCLERLWKSASGPETVLEKVRRLVEYREQHPLNPFEEEIPLLLRPHEQQAWTQALRGVVQGVDILEQNLKDYRKAPWPEEWHDEESKGLLEEVTRFREGPDCSPLAEAEWLTGEFAFFRELDDFDFLSQRLDALCEPAWEDLQQVPLVGSDDDLLSATLDRFRRVPWTEGRRAVDAESLAGSIAAWKQLRARSSDFECASWLSSQNLTNDPFTPFAARLLADVSSSALEDALSQIAEESDMESWLLLASRVLGVPWEAVLEVDPLHLLQTRDFVKDYEALSSDFTSLQELELLCRYRLCLPLASLYAARCVELEERAWMESSVPKGPLEDIKSWLVRLESYNRLSDDLKEHCGTPSRAELPELMAWVREWKEIRNKGLALDEAEWLVRQRERFATGAIRDAIEARLAALRVLAEDGITADLDILSLGKIDEQFRKGGRVRRYEDCWGVTDCSEGWSEEHRRFAALDRSRRIKSELRAALRDRDKYSSVFPEGPDEGDVAALLGRVLWDLKNVAPKGFCYKRTEYFQCNGKGYWIVIVGHTETGLEFCLIPGGSFVMGRNQANSTAAPVNEVSVSPFLVCRTEVTRGAWKRVMGGEPWTEALPDIPGEGDDVAASDMSWNGATEFCRRTDLELPSEAQWEYASRGGTQTIWFFGDSAEELGQYAWYADNTREKARPRPVGRKRPNPFGLVDTAGNVYEWCQDAYQEGDTGAPKTDLAREEIAPLYRAFRGGGYSAGAGYQTVYARFGKVPGDASCHLGFRPCKRLP